MSHPDPAFPALHARPARGWVNDPNGLAFVDGRWHVFFQHNPVGPAHHEIGWGHASSADLVHWDAEPLALRARPDGPDAFGCWSGCVTDDDGVPTAVYSAVLDDSGRSAVVLARSDRTLRTWTQDDTPVAGMPEDPRVTAMRDPFVVHVDGHRYAVQAAGRPGGPPALLVHGCDDLTDWRPLGALLTADDDVAAAVAPAHVWECPNLVRVGDRWLLVVSLWRDEPNPTGLYALHGVRYLLGDVAVTPDGPRLAAASGGLLDDGPCFYAPQLLAADGRVLLWGWAWELGRPQAEIDAAGWSGCLTFPREVTVEGDDVVSRPVRELVALRDQEQDSRSSAALPGPAVDVARPAGTGGRLLLDGREVLAWPAPPVPVQPARVLLDGSMVEVFPGGPRPVTTRAYPRAGSTWTLEWDGDDVARAWRLRP